MQTAPNESCVFFDHYYSPRKKSPFHYDRLPRISIVLQGKLREKAGQQEFFGGPASVVIKPTDVLHENEYGPQGARILSIILKDSLMRTLAAQKELSQWQWFHPRQTARAVTKYLRRIKEQDEATCPTIEFVSALLNQPDDLPKTKPDWLPLLIEQIKDEPGHPYSVQQLAAKVGVHPVYLARVFQKYCRCGVKEYIHQVRLQRIIEALSNTSKPLVDIAFQLGYADQAHMSRYFKQGTGMSPGAFRKLIKGF